MSIWRRTFCMKYKRYSISGLLMDCSSPLWCTYGPWGELVWHSWPISIVSAVLGTVVDSPWALRSCSASWCKSPEEEPPKFKMRSQDGSKSSITSTCSTGYYWPVESCCAPKRCLCSPGASCTSRCSSQNDSWGKRRNRGSQHLCKTSELFY